MPSQEPLKRLYDTLEARLRTVEELVDALSDEPFRWRPAPKKWSVAEVLEHLSIIAEQYLPRLETAIEEGHKRDVRSERTEFRYPGFWRKFIKAVGPQGSPSLRSPKKFRPPQEAPQASFATAERAVVLERFRLAHQQLLAALEAAEGLDLARVRHRNPLLPLISMPIGVSFELLLAHLERHLGQMQALREQQATT